MRLIKNKRSPVITVNANGKIIKRNLAASKVVKILEGEYIFEIIDADLIRKLSMYPQRIEIVKTRLEEYPDAIMKVSTNGNTKRIEIFLKEKEENEDFDASKENKILGLYNDSVTQKSTTGIAISEELKLIIAKIGENKALSRYRIELEVKKDFRTELDADQIDLLFITTVFLLNDICYDSDKIKILVDENNVKLSVNHNNAAPKSNFTALAQEYPYMASKIMMLSAICENEKIEHRILGNLHSFEIQYKLPYARRSDLAFKAADVSREDKISAIIDTFARLLSE